jgi:hypothetical protein
MRKAYALFIEDMIMQGKLILPGTTTAMEGWLYFLEHKAELTAVEFFGASKDEIDLAKSAEFYIAQKELGVFTHDSICNEMLDEDWEDRYDQIIDEVKTLHQKLSDCGDKPDWTVAQVVSERLQIGQNLAALPASQPTDDVTEDEPTDDAPEDKTKEGEEA